MDKPEVIAGPTKLTKIEKLAKAAEGCKRMMDWLVPGKSRPAVKEWFDDPDLPELEEVEMIETRELAKLAAKRVENESVCRELLDEMVKELEARSAAKMIMEEVIGEAWKKWSHCGRPYRVTRRCRMPY